MVRPLFWDQSGVSELWDIEDAFLLGDGLLVAPILEPACSQRMLAFPPGEWVSLWDDADILSGPATLTARANLHTIPVFVRAGSVLPQVMDGRLELHIYPPAPNPQKDVQYKGYGQLYSDSGDGYGPWRLDQFDLHQVGSTLEITWRTTSDTRLGAYPFPYDSVTVQLHGSQIEKAWLNALDASHDNHQVLASKFETLRIQLSGDC
jgi:alpha-glucosidase